MRWPIESDYFTAVQNPQTNFADPELRAGTVTTDKLGLPKPITGAFASVYQLTCPDGRRWAVRCFLRDIPDQRARYAAISAHLRSIKLPYTVAFEYIERGIRINSQWYPILKMEWIDGVPLNVYVEQNLANRQVLQSLAKKWIEMIAAMKRTAVAHGDLQHGNVLVAGGTLRLIDYDGMYVPALNGMPSREDGHRNYQHPKRSGADFHAQLDNFSAWVVFLSISALAVDPSLWVKVNAGDECLLFRREDFERPGSSRAMAALDFSGRPELQSLSVHLKSLLYLPLVKVPGLDGLSAVSTAQPVGTAGGIPEWLSGHLPERKREALYSEPAATTAVVAGADWLFDHLLDQKPAQPALAVLSVTLDRVLLTILAVFTFTSAGMFAAIRTDGAIWLAGGLAIGGFVAAYALLALRYAADRLVGEKKTAARKLAATRRAVARIEDEIQAVNVERQSVLEPLVALDRGYRSLPQQLSSVLRGIEAGLTQALEAFAARAVALDQKERDELQRIDGEASSLRDGLARRRNELAAAEAHEHVQLLEQVRENHVRNVMTTSLIFYANLPGIGPKLKDSLIACGIRTAADVGTQVNSVPGIGQARASTLLWWRDHIYIRALMDAPSQLPNPDAARLSAKYDAERRAIEERIAAVAREQSRGRQGVSTNYLRYRHQVSQEEEAARRDCQKRRDETTIRFQNEKERLAREFENVKSRIDAQRRDLDAHLVELNQFSFRRRMDLNADQRDLDRYRRVTFVGYLLRVFGLRSAA